MNISITAVSIETLVRESSTQPEIIYSVDLSESCIREVVALLRDYLHIQDDPGFDSYAVNALNRRDADVYQLSSPYSHILPETLEIVVVHPYLLNGNPGFSQDRLFINSFYPMVIENEFSIGIVQAFYSQSLGQSLEALLESGSTGERHKTCSLFGYVDPTPLTHISSSYSRLAIRSSNRVESFMHMSKVDSPWTVIMGASASLNWYSPDSNTFSSIISRSIGTPCIQLGAAGATISDNIEQCVRLILSNANVTRLIWYGGFNDFAYGLRNSLSSLRALNWIDSHFSQGLLFKGAGLHRHEDFALAPPKVPSCPPETVLYTLNESLAFLRSLCVARGIEFAAYLQPSLVQISYDGSHLFNCMRLFSPQYINGFAEYISYCYDMARKMSIFSKVFELDSPTLFRDIVHLSPAGDRIVSEALVKSIKNHTNADA